MADFTTQLAAPQGAGAQVLQPVQQNTVAFSPDPLLSQVVNVFSKGLENTRKQEALDKQNAVLKEYYNNEQVYSDALISGQWNASQTSTSSRANFQKFLAAYPELTDELTKARNAVYTGTEIGQAQQQVDQSLKLHNDQVAAARSAGFVIPDFASPDTQNAMVTAHQNEIRLDKQISDTYKRNAENRAAAGENRAAQSHNIQIADHEAKQTATQGLVQLYSNNIDALSGLSKDLISNNSVPFEQKQIVFSQQINRLKSGLVSISASNPELAAPFNKLVDDIHTTFNAIADPGKKSAAELQALNDEYQTLLTKSKLLVISDPTTRNAVALSSLFPNNPTLLGLATSPVLMGNLAKLGLGPGSGGQPQVVGTTDEKAALNTIKGALNLLQKGAAKGDSTQNQTEAVNTVNAVLKQNGTLQGSIPPQQLKELSSFYSSTEFGKLAESGALDSQTMQNVKQIFQVNYEPAVIQAVQNRLTQVQIRPGVKDFAPPQQKPLIDYVDVNFSGRGVTFSAKPGTDASFSTNSNIQSLKEAQDGLNAVVRMGAHLEGTTNYAKYWEDNKHLLLPAVFPDPARLKPGQVVNGFKYIGGKYSDKSSWQPVGQ